MTKFFHSRTVTLRRTTSILAVISLCALGPQFTLAADGTGTITFQDIYENPDDQQLNLAYAKQQVDAGDLVSAAAALERMLFAQPNWDSARLFYALTLYQLDDRQAAVREMNLLSTRPLTSSQRELLNRYQSDFKGEKTVNAAPSLRGRIALGARYDDNAGNALGDVIFGGRDQSDVSGTVQAVAVYSTPISANGNTRVSLRGDAQIRRHETVSDADFDTYGLDAGINGRAGALTWTVGADVLTVNVSGESYLDEFGGYASVSGAFSPQLIWTLRGEYKDQNYNDLNFTTNEVNRSGRKSVIDGGLEYSPNKSLLLSANLSYEDKKARDNTLAYDGFRARARAVYSINSDSYLSASAQYRDIKYDGDSIFLFPAEPRADENINGRVAAGIKANRILESFGASPSNLLAPITFEIAGNYVERKTNIPRSGYDNLGGEFKVILDF